MQRKWEKTLECADIQRKMEGAVEARDLEAGEKAGRGREQVAQPVPRPLAAWILKLPHFSFGEGGGGWGEVRAVFSSEEGTVVAERRRKGVHSED